ncbi:uncharacterized protein LOC109839303 [Asparagus officinalis]|uniref:uncharacterized protein LOC109839303 n=1 Tax=Asparagus officinalis TaxID=4686 RepID=UPI00098E23F7|nr:uncharacterized protein LOC109839303 [Asparagus officinalis]
MFGGDFRQILSVIPEGSRADIVLATINSSYLWDNCQVLTLYQNIRLQSGSSNNEVLELREFSEWLLSISDGRVSEPNDGEALIEVPNNLLIKDFTNSLAAVIENIIGELITIGNVKEVESNGNKRKLLQLELQDNNLWGNYADQVLSYVKNANSGVVIMVIHLTKIKLYGGKLTITNALYASKILINPDIPEVTDLKRSLKLVEDSSSQKFSHIPTEKAYSIEDDFLLVTEWKMLHEIQEAHEVCTCVTLATIEKIRTDYNWFYNACNKCKKKVNAENGKFHCDNCNEDARFVTPRYKVHVLVIDHISTA